VKSTVRLNEMHKGGRRGEYSRRPDDRVPPSPTFRERPILFSGPMVKAILEGRKTQTRRIIQPQPEKKDGGWYWSSPRYDNGDGVHYFHTVILTPSLMEAWEAACSYGVPGERLWVRETWSQPGGRLRYKADDEERTGKNRDVHVWVPSIHMFRRHSRLDLEITEVRVERLQEISEEDARAEGACRTPAGCCRGCNSAGRNHTWPQGHPDCSGTGHARLHGFSALWDEINGKRAPWASNPWVWAITFRRIP